MSPSVLSARANRVLAIIALASTFALVSEVATAQVIINGRPFKSSPNYNAGRAKSQSAHRVPYNAHNPSQIHGQKTRGRGASRNGNGRRTTYYVPQHSHSHGHVHVAPPIYGGYGGRFGYGYGYGPQYVPPIAYGNTGIGLTVINPGIPTRTYGYSGGFVPGGFAPVYRQQVFRTQINPVPPVALPGQNGYGQPLPQVNPTRSIYIDSTTDAPRSSTSRAHEAIDYLNAGRRALNATELSQNLVSTTYDAATYQTQAENAFRNGDFDAAAKHLRHALVEDPENGKLQLFAAHIAIATSDYASARKNIEAATARLHQNEWDYLVRNRSRLYSATSLESDLNRLNEHLSRNPAAANELLVRGFVQGCLGFVDLARSDFSQVVAADATNELGVRMLAALRQPVVAVDGVATEILPAPSPELIQGQMILPPVIDQSGPVHPPTIEAPAIAAPTINAAPAIVEPPGKNPPASIPSVVPQEAPVIPPVPESQHAPKPDHSPVEEAGETHSVLQVIDQ